MLLELVPSILACHTPGADGHPPHAVCEQPGVSDCLNASGAFQRKQSVSM